jgi:hypothetical protein
MKNGTGAGKGAGLKVATGLKGGRIAANHNPTAVVGLRVKTALKAGKLSSNHNLVLR